MSQYKYAMERIFNQPSNQLPLSEKSVEQDNNNALPFLASTLETECFKSSVSFLNSNALWILRSVIPCLWVICFILIMDRESVITFWYMPILGIFAACLANCVPIGGGIVYVPALSLLGVDMKLSVAFTVATMTCGNGTFGFLKWLNKDHTLILWYSMYFTVIPSWLGTICSLAFTQPDVSVIRLLFGVFCLLLAIYVIYMLYKKNTVTADNISPAISYKDVDMKSWLVLALISFFGGLVLVPNIGIGPALTTYLTLAYFGIKDDSAIVTGIIVGGWVSIVPFIIHAMYFKDVPYNMWMMVLPGVYIGAQLAPVLYAKIGTDVVLGSFGIFLIATSFLYLFH
jgi:uncharacterized membrane protein YfcA